jgi:heme exporter protein D
MTATGMSYLGYVVAAYAVFAVVLAWDLVAPLLRIRRVLRDVRLRTKRAASRKDAPLPTELQR